ncbi:hypothetical protein V6N13_117402 [Hibiscus sabdariffa]
MMANVYAPFVEADQEVLWGDFASCWSQEVRRLLSSVGLAASLLLLLEQSAVSFNSQLQGGSRSYLQDYSKLDDLNNCILH